MPDSGTRENNGAAVSADVHTRARRWRRAAGAGTQGAWSRECTVSQSDRALLSLCPNVGTDPEDSGMHSSAE
jgi:hypothetical protein